MSARIGDTMATDRDDANSVHLLNRCEVPQEKLIVYPEARPKVLDYLVLIKPRLTLLVLVTVAVGFILATPGSVDMGSLLCAVLGVGLVSGGAGALNQVVERDLDAKMQRTRNRPLPTGRLSTTEALCFAIGCCLAGLALLVVVVNWLTAFLALLSLGIYILAYTPLKVRTVLNTGVGAICGALPPMMGWAAASGEVALGGWLLFLILYAWQLPHFLAIAWIYREDYAAAGMKMLGTGGGDGRIARGGIALVCLLLLPVSLLPAIVGQTGPAYAFLAAALGAALLALGLRLWARDSRHAARQLFFATLFYLPCLLAAVMMGWIAP